MGYIHRIIKNFAALSVAQFSLLILGLVLSVYIARALGDTVFGQYSFAMAFTSLFAIFSDLGYNTLIIREVSRNKPSAKNYLNNVLSMRLLLCILIYVLLVLSINYSNYPTELRKLVYLLGLSILIDSLSTVFKVLFRAFENMDYEAKATVYYALAKTSLSLLALYLGYGLLSLGFIFVFVSIIQFFYLYYICRDKFLIPKLKFNLEFWENTLIIALPLSITGISLLLYTRVDTILLSYMKDDATVAWYNAAYNLILSFKPVPQLMMNALFPLMAGSSLTNKVMFKKISEISLKLLIYLGFPLTTGILLLSKKIIYFLYGSQYANSIIALQILSLDLILYFVWIHGVFILININKQKEWASAAISTAFLNIMLNFILIPSYSYVGSSAATIISELICVLIIYYYIYENIDLSLNYDNSLLKIIISTVVMAFIIYIFNEFDLVIIIIISILFYMILSYAIGAISKEEISLILRRGK